MKATAHNILKLASKIPNPGRVRFRAQRAGMAGGFTATSRFVGLLVGFAAFGAALAHAASRTSSLAVSQPARCWEGVRNSLSA
jgi:hypothetical protein